ncbi:hypothetical protein SEEH1023_16101 [Salmonella enterica subsp. enterica serovar Heidelberg str. 670102-3]|nr:hypothetical protein SEEH1565_18032 [Salmonella enterica subsp. enterica serovar Heidelberg str. 41565]ESE55150.1 hypothetical protein SEEH2052_02214 [Salmonella enterica subsp. enterica serovar Heidelberg str. 82-2052]EYH71573.1 hypothetical protein SEEH9992_14420 [Salmonella enterica subsp. enterica serovar Heidelberg str. N19992]EYH74264.1 hypothetical protein SEEHN189_05006 [Salmonella enterica subsp. enterica serovar Heidelberg str. N189]EYI12239.1 hypothetical protein SEEH4630_00755 [S
MSAQQGACESGQIWPIFTDIKQVQEKCIAYPNIRTNLYISRVVAEEIKVISWMHFTPSIFKIIVKSEVSVIN